jgi:nucleoside-diphosphate-sugar epimerase
MSAPTLISRRPQPTTAIIGGTGFIGRVLTRALAASGQDVRVISRGTQDAFQDIADRVETVSVSLSDVDCLVRALRGMEVVVNLAQGETSTWEAALNSDVAQSERLARAAAQAGVGRFVHTGTIASYDMSDSHAVIDESTPFGPLERRNPYARSKAEGESLNPMPRSGIVSTWWASRCLPRSSILKNSLNV